MEKEPWQEDIYEENKEESRSERHSRSGKWAFLTANNILTTLAIIFFIVVIGMIIVLVYLSSGGSDRTSALKDFYDSANPKVEEVTTVTTATTETTTVATTESGEQQNTTEAHTDPEGTITVLAGEGEAAIAARAGISIAQLEALNPSHMSTGSWFANPGDVLKTR